MIVVRVVGPVQCRVVSRLVYVHNFTGLSLQSTVGANYLSWVKQSIYVVALLSLFNERERERERERDKIDKIILYYTGIKI